MKLRQAITERKSIRVFKPDPVPRKLIEKVLKAGMLAPSSANMQPWEFAWDILIQPSQSITFSHRE